MAIQTRQATEAATVRALHLLLCQCVNETALFPNSFLRPFQGCFTISPGKLRVLFCNPEDGYLVPC